MKYFILVFLLVVQHWANAQDFVHKDEKTSAIIRQGLDKMYNFEFQEADALFLEVKKKYPQSPAYEFLMSMNGFWKVFYNNTYKEKSKENYNLLLSALEKNKKLDEKYPNHPEVVFFYMSIYSSIALIHTQEKQTVAAINYSKKTYDYFRLGYELKDAYKELYFSAGIYDFFREQYPETHPVYRSFMWLFAAGDKQRGLKELEVAAKYAVFTSTEARFYAVIIQLKYNNKPIEALVHTQFLNKSFPKNYNYLARNVEALLICGKYQDAEKLLPTLASTQRKYFDMAYFALQGLCYEKYKKNNDLAFGYYSKAVQISKQIEFPVNDYVGYAYLGIARIFKAKGDVKSAKAYFQKALDNSDYLSIQEEASKNLR